MATALLPLRYRLPNPPPVFVGRRREMATLARMVLRAPVTVVRGFGGVGKTALVLATLHQRLQAGERSVVLVRVPATDRAGGIHQELGRALGAGRASPIVWPAQASDDDLAAGLIDLAEHEGRWVVLDDLHAVDPEAAAGLMGALARYARRTRWIATTRESVPTVPAAQELVLDGLGASDLARLARAAAPRSARDVRARAVATAAGSPWRLLEALAGRDPRAGGPLDHLPAAARALLERLALIDLPLDQTAVAALGADDGALGLLERGGLLERTPAGVRLHDLGREALGTGASALHAREVGRALTAAGDPTLALEGARLLLEAGDRDGAAAAVRAFGPASIEGGDAHRLWACLARLPQAGLEGLRLRCAVELGRADAVAAVGPPPESDRGARYWWARALFQVGQVAGAGEAASSVAAAGVAGTGAAAADAADGEVAFDAALLHARCLGTLGRFEEALAVLSPLAASADPVRRARAHAHRARWLLQSDAPAARALAQALVRGLADLPPAAAREVAERAAGIFVFLGRFRDATAVLPELGARRDIRHPELFFDRELLLWRLAVVTFSAAAPVARRLGRRIRELGDAAPSQRQYADLLALPVMIAAGELDDVSAAIDRLAADAAACGHAQIHHFTSIYRVKLALVQGLRRLPASDRPPAVAPPSGLEQLHLHLLEVQHARRWGFASGEVQLCWTEPIAGGSEPVRGFRGGSDGGPTAGLLLDRAGEAEVVSVGIARAIVVAELALIDGDLPAAQAEAARACALASEHDQRLIGIEALQARCEVALASGAMDGVAAAGAALDAAAGELELPRFTIEARFFAALSAAATPAGIDAGALEACAAAAGTAPVAARRARALLAGDPAAETLDALDRVVLAAARRAGGEQLATLDRRPPDDRRAGTAVAWRPGWGIDDPRRAVWLPDGRYVDLTAAPLGARLLDVLCDHGGAASKEMLTVTVWGDCEYHPLRHDKRLQVAVLRLRRLIEDDPSRPARLVTTDDGYALGTAEPIRRLRPSPPS